MTQPPLPIRDATQRYLEGYLTARNLAPLTRVNYASDLKHLARYLTERLGLEHIGQVQLRHLDGYLSTLDAEGLKGSSRRRKVATIRSLFRFLVQQDVLAESPAERLLPPEREREERRVLTEAEYKRLLGAVQHEARDGAIIELLLQTGTRESECGGIRLSDIHLPARVSRDAGNVGSLRVHGKGRKERHAQLQGLPGDQGLPRRPPQGRRGAPLPQQVREAPREPLDPQPGRQVPPGGGNPGRIDPQPAAHLRHPPRQEGHQARRRPPGPRPRVAGDDERLRRAGPRGDGQGAAAERALAWGGHWQDTVSTGSKSKKTSCRISIHDMSLSQLLHWLSMIV